MGAAGFDQGPVRIGTLGTACEGPDVGNFLNRSRIAGRNFTIGIAGDTYHLGQQI